MVAYPALFMPEDDGGFSVIFRDLPEANAFGDDLERTLEAAMDGLGRGVGVSDQVRRALAKAVPGRRR